MLASSRGNSIILWKNIYDGDFLDAVCLIRLNMEFFLVKNCFNTSGFILLQSLNLMIFLPEFHLKKLYKAER